MNQTYRVLTEKFMIPELLPGVSQAARKRPRFEDG